MDTHRKQGEVYLQHQKHGEKWKRYWLTLHPASRHGVARLELSEAVRERSTVVVRRHPEKKVVRLADCVTVVKLPPHAEACPGENMAAFCVETEDKRLVFAAEKESCGEWVDIICNIAFQVWIFFRYVFITHYYSKIWGQILLKENFNSVIYNVSFILVSEFKVVVLQNEASVRCGLKGQYWLQAGEDMLVLQDLETRRTVIEWPYKLLRRYGRDKMLFSIEAGRRCESGPGTFNFETRQSDEILRLIESAICQQKSLTVTGDRQSPHSPRSHAKLPLNPNPADVLGPNIYASLNPVHTKPASPIGLTEPVYANPADSISSSKSAHSDPGGSISLIEPVYSNPAVLIGSHEPVYADIKTDPLPSHHRDESEPVYSDPADVIRPKPNNCVQANPTDMTDCRPVKTTPNNGKEQEPVYSVVYDHVRLNTSKRLDQETEEPIYSVPEIVQSTQNNNSQQNKMPEENQPIYSKVNKPPKTPQPFHEKKLSQTPEVVSEDLGMI
uniref:Docking protein 1a n=1 Tax=Cyprinus carpio TaxID=7962 RepID=A0A8C1W8M8_CYPCA